MRCTESSVAVPLTTAKRTEVLLSGISCSTMRASEEKCPLCPQDLS